MRPGVEVTTRADRSARGTESDNGAWFVTGFAERGPAGEAVEISSLSEFEDTFGERASYSQLWDALELFFAEGGATAFVSRVVGPAPVKASKTFNDAGAAAALTVTALYHGDYANGATGGLKAGIDNVSAGNFDLFIQWDGVEVERFSGLADVTAAIAAAADSDYVRVTDPGAVGDPVAAAAANLTGGTDDHASAVEAQWTAALAYFVKDLGPGQISAPGRTTTDAHKALIDHARANNRTAYLDVADSASKSTMTAAAAALAAYAGSEYAGIFGSWKLIPGLAIGTSRSVPGSAFAAGVTARTDALEGTSGAAPAGQVSEARYALDVKLPTGGLTDEDYEDLNSAGVNMSRNFRTGGVQLYGFRSVTDDSDWTYLTANRLRVSLAARCEAVGRGYVFEPPTKKTFADLNGELSAECLIDYNAGALYGDSPDEAFRVDTGNTVNTTATIEAGEINAEVYGRFTPLAELVRIAVVKVPVSAGV
jgi:hypothetical protein